MAKPRFSLEQVGTFVAVARTRSMSKAAEELFVTQGAVSQQIRHLEAALGLQLVERGGRELLVTEAGAAIASACSTAVRDAETIIEVAQLHRGLAVGSLKVGASSTCASHYLPALLAAFTRDMPLAEVAVTVGNSPSVATMVASGELDCGLIEGPAGKQRLDERRVVEDEAVLIVGVDHPLAGLKTVEAADLVGHRYLCRQPITVPPRNGSLEAIAASMVGVAFQESSRLVLTHPDAIRAAAIQGLGFAVLPRVSVARELEDGSLVQLPVPGRKRWIRALRRPGSHVPAVERFWALLPAEPSDVARSAARRSTARTRARSR
jgi:DNA-binding transcriptional LysR family regulator